MKKRVSIDNQTILELIKKHILESGNIPEGTDVTIEEVVVQMFGPIPTEGGGGMIVYRRKSPGRIMTFNLCVDVAT